MLGSGLIGASIWLQMFSRPIEVMDYGLAILVFFSSAISGLINHGFWGKPCNTAAGVARFFLASLLTTILGAGIAGTILALLENSELKVIAMMLFFAPTFVLAQLFSGACIFCLITWLVGFVFLNSLVSNSRD